MEQKENYATQLLWTLLTSCKTIEYAVKELNHTMPEKYNHKGDFIRLDKAIQAYMRVFQGRVTKAESELFEGILLYFGIATHFSVEVETIDSRIYDSIQEHHHNSTDLYPLDQIKSDIYNAIKNHIAQ